MLKVSLWGLVNVCHRLIYACWVDISWPSKSRWITGIYETSVLLQFAAIWEVCARGHRSIRGDAGSLLKFEGDLLSLRRSEHSVLPAPWSLATCSGIALRHVAAPFADMHGIQFLLSAGLSANNFLAVGVSVPLAAIDDPRGRRLTSVQRVLCSRLL